MSAKATAQQPDAVELHAAALLEMIVVTFERAYALAAMGMSVEEMLIDYDIQAAASDQDESVSACARTVIKAAANAVLRGIPFDLAFACLMQRAHNYVLDILRQPHEQ
jgi:hypothetical protein